MPTEANINTVSLYSETAKVFYPYTTSTAYINPYSSDRMGGELITEYNQRNALNTLCKKDMHFEDFAEAIKTHLLDVFGEDDTTAEPDPTTGEYPRKGAGLYSFVDERYTDTSVWHADVYATGVRDEHDFDITYAAGYVYIKPGKAMINGYNIDSDAEIKIDLHDMVTMNDIDDVKNRSEQLSSPKIVSKFVKLALMYVTDGAHDERLNPPVNGTYKAVALVVDDVLLRENELLLGVITVSDYRAVEIMLNPLKTRILPLDVVAGAEGYDELVNTAGMEDGFIYGLTKNTEHHITDITNKLWLDRGSNLAKLLRGLEADPEPASVDTPRNTRAVITTVGLNGGAGNSSSALRQSLGTFPLIDWYQAYALEGDANATFELRKLYYPFAYCDDTVINKSLVDPPSIDAPKQYTYTDRDYPEIHGRTGKSGFITGQQVFMLEQAYAHAKNPTDAGIQYGPFMTVEDAKNWFASHGDREYKLGDYFWVLNDEIKGVTADYGEVYGEVTGSVAGTVSGTVSGTATVNGTVTGNVSGTVTGTTEEQVTVTGTVTGEISGDAVGTGSIASAPVTGNVSGTASGTVTGKWSNFVQHVSTRYSCVYSGPGTSGTNKGVKAIASLVSYVGNTMPPEPIGTYTLVSDNGHAWFALQAAERGFSVPATASSFGLVKAAREGDTSATIRDVVINASTGRLNISTALYNAILSDGFDVVAETVPDQVLEPGDSLEPYCNKRYARDGFKFILKGLASKWETLDDSLKTLKNIRGHIIIDYSGTITDTDPFEVDDSYAGGTVFNLNNVDYVTLLGNNSQTAGHVPTSSVKFSFSHCIVDNPFFENIGSWKASSFLSGSNTIELNNPWMSVDKIFSKNDYINNKLYARFSSVTIGENGISSAMMDMWIQYENTQSDSRSVDYCWHSLEAINFPPLMYEFDEEEGGSSVTTGNINMSTIQYIPSELSMKIGATAGVHEVLPAQNEATQNYIVSGNLLATVDWSYNTRYGVDNAPAEKLYLNLYMKNSSGDSMQKISNLKFRVPVQISRMSDNSSVWYVDYKSLYPSP